MKRAFSDNPAGEDDAPFFTGTQSELVFERKTPASIKADYTGTIKAWLKEPLAKRPFDKTHTEILFKPDSNHFDLRMTLNDTVTCEDKSEAMSDIGRWARETRPADLMRGSYLRPVFGDASQIAASRAEFKLSQPHIDFVKGTATVRFSFKGLESKHAFLQALAEEQARTNGAQKLERGA